MCCTCPPVTVVQTVMLLSSVKAMRSFRLVQDDQVVPPWSCALLVSIMGMLIAGSLLGQDCQMASRRPSNIIACMCLLLHQGHPVNVHNQPLLLKPGNGQECAMQLYRVHCMTVRAHTAPRHRLLEILHAAGLTCMKFALPALLFRPVATHLPHSTRSCRPRSHSMPAASASRPATQGRQCTRHCA